LPGSSSTCSPDLGPGPTSRGAGRLPVCLLLGAALVLLAPGTALADWFIIPAAGLSFGSDWNLIDLEDATGTTKLTIQGSVVWLSKGWFGVSGEVCYVDGFFEREQGERLISHSNVTTSMGGVIVSLPQSWTRNSLRPYAIGAFGLIHASIKDVYDVLPVKTNLMGLRIGGGVTGFVTDTVGVQWDLSYFRTLKGQGSEGGVCVGSCALDFWRASMGIVLRF
jgi:hypothetical protein